jgi:catechol 2,3-dioxygenase-like lactoylglutathione lyase family enzyme
MSSAPPTTPRFDAAVPQFTVPDVVRTAEYYRDVLGFQIAGYWGTPPVFAIVWRDRVEVFFNRADQSPARTGRAKGAYDAYFRVVGVTELATQVRTGGADIVEGPVTREYQQLELVIRDCNGLILTFGEDTSKAAVGGGS